jgi:hypothetical protein
MVSYTSICAVFAFNVIVPVTGAVLLDIGSSLLEEGAVSGVSPKQPAPSPSVNTIAVAIIEISHFLLINFLLLFFISACKASACSFLFTNALQVPFTLLYK